MKTVILLFMLLLSSQIGHSLTCYDESMKVVNCLSLNTHCYTLSASHLTLKGCTSSSLCSQEGYSCCEEDLCNSAVIPRTSVLLAVTAVVVLWIAKVF
ncbi:short neurotoxin 3-like [Dendropsophus ebraccatus]|uniref:short neurotoxin 3-like n=1 Tax=Dendropsophus ebraccatus TaxID=150705 RepID=UPI0038315137